MCESLQPEKKLFTTSYISLVSGTDSEKDNRKNNDKFPPNQHDLGVFLWG